MNIEQIRSYLPEYLHECLDELAERTVRSSDPLKVCLVGAFSTGKSSLLNMMLGENLLPVALEETTSLPTFIEYGDAVTMQQLWNDGRAEDITPDTFQRNTVNAPSGVACTILRLPLEWLRGLALLDLPGLGSKSTRNREYTVAQIRLSDTVIYLLANRGPGLEDIETLSLIRQYGKRLKVVVSQWDIVEKSVSEGEKMPDLEQWAGQLENGSGIRKPRLVPVSREGMGRDDLLEFLGRAKGDLALIRERRFIAELQPVIENAIGRNLDEQQACGAMSEEAIQRLHIDLLNRKNELLEFKSSLYSRQATDHAKLQRDSAELLTAQRKRLSESLGAKRDAIEKGNESKQWDSFLQGGDELLRSAIAETAQQLSELSGQYGKLELPQERIETLNLRLPQPEQLDPVDFIDYSRLSHLEKILSERVSQGQETESKRAQILLPTEELSGHEQEIAELRRQHGDIQSMQLPRLIEKVESGGMGKTIGKMVGEIADIALIFVNPTTVATKTASLVGKGAKIAKVSVDAAKVAANAKKVIQTAKAVQTGKKTIPGVKELGMLEMLSLGYWGEKIGGMFDSPPHYNEYIDPVALAAQQAALNEVNGRISELNKKIRSLKDIEIERELSGVALEQNRQEQALIARQIDNLKKQAEKDRQDAQKEADSRQSELVRQQIEKARNHWLACFDRQTETMLGLLYSSCKSYWNDYVSQMLDGRIGDVEQLSEQLKMAPVEKEQNIARLKQELGRMESAKSAILSH